MLIFLHMGIILNVTINANCQLMYGCGIFNKIQ